MAININNNQISSNKANIDINYGPYVAPTLELALNLAKSSLQYKENKGRTISIQIENGPIKEYWYQPNQSNVLELVEKQAESSNVFGYYNSGDGKFYKEDSYETEIIGEEDKIYIDLATNTMLRYDVAGSVYEPIGDSEVVDTTPTEGSNNPVSSGGVYTALSGKADKSEMSVTDGTGANADKTTIQLKNGTSATVLKQHQDISGKVDKVSDATENNFVSFDENGGIQDNGFSDDSFIKGVKQNGVELQKDANGKVAIKKLSFKALFIGNSISQDHITYLPFLLREVFGDNVDFTISIFYIGGYTISDYVDNCLDGTVKAAVFSTANNTDVWTNENNTVTLLQAIQRNDWDIISMEGYWNTTVSDDMSDYPVLVDFFVSNANKPFELAWLMHQSYASDSVKENLINGAKIAITEHPTSILFSPFFAIEYAKEYFQTSDLTPDNTHNREGLPCMIGAYHVFGMLLEKYGLGIKVLSNNSKMTAAIWQTLNIPGANGMVDESFGTTENYRKAQKAAIKSIEAAHGFFNESRRVMYESKVPSTTIMRTIVVTPNDQSYGSVSGGGMYQEGSQVQILATPSTGYEFMCWDDGNTSQNRTITVSSNVAYIAIFQMQGMTSLLGLSGILNLGTRLHIDASTENILTFSETNKDGSHPLTGCAVQIPYPSGYTAPSPSGSVYKVSATVDVNVSIPDNVFGIGTYIMPVEGVDGHSFKIFPLRQGVNYLDFEVDLFTLVSNDYILYLGFPNNATPAPNGTEMSFTRLNIKKIA